MKLLSTSQALALRQAVEYASQIREIPVRVQRLYDEVQRNIELQSPRCEQSGRCCRFENYGHKLFVTTVELAVFCSYVKDMLVPIPETMTEGCTYQSDRLCTVHLYRPFGCRMFFCDPSVTEWQQEQYEYFHLQLRQLHQEFAVPYMYVEWRQALKALFNR